MTFLNPGILAGLAAVAIPIIIHLFNRRKARNVEWGAMCFLTASVANRNRRILIEEIILIALRCMAVALVVMAAARPFLPSDASVPSAMVVPAVLAGAILAGVATVMYERRLLRWALYGAAGLLVTGSAAMSLAELLSQEETWAGGRGDQDVCIVLDGSMSMTMSADGRPNFERAIGEAREVVAACRRADTVSVILAGPAPRRTAIAPTSDREALDNALDRLQKRGPTGGSMGLLAALDLAATTLAEGRSAIKKVVLITDGQNAGWDAANEARWRFLAGSFSQLPTTPKVVCRVLGLPRHFTNAGIGDVALSRRAIGTDRPVAIRVTVQNTGTTTTDPSALEMAPDDAEPVRRPVGIIQPNCVEMIEFRHRFREPGRHVLRFTLLGDDAMVADNEDVRVVNVLRELPVLLVDGAPSADLLGGAASFLQAALAPEPITAQSGHRRHDLVRPTVVPVDDIASVHNFADYGAVCLVNVSRLPAATAAALAVYVKDGGGLLIAPGDRSAPSFYASWQYADGSLLAPARLAERLSDDQAELGVAGASFNHPALATLAIPGLAEKVLLKAHWCLEPHEGNDVRVAGKLSNNDPLMVERLVGRGRVLMTAMSLDPRDSNLPAQGRCFVPLAHEITYFLAAPTMVGTDVAPGTPLTYDVARDPEQEGPANAVSRDGGEVAVVAPSGETLSGMLAPTSRAWRVSFMDTGEPGEYRIMLPPGLVEPESLETEPAGMPFTVRRNPREGFLTALSPSDFERVGAQVDIFRADSTEEMLAATVGQVPGDEIWRQMVACALLALLAEVAVARWITHQRKSATVEEVHFKHEQVDLAEYRTKLGSAVVPSETAAAEVKR